MASSVETAKGVVSIVRDGLITVILILLLAMPATVNSSLVRAGFVKGNIAGFEWQAVRENVDDNNKKLGEATATIETLQGQLTKTQDALNESEAARVKLAQQVTMDAPGTVAADLADAAPVPKARQIATQNRLVLQNSEAHGDILRQQIRVNDQLLATVSRPAGN